jgi:hypothetical protein
MLRSQLRFIFLLAFVGSLLSPLADTSAQEPPPDPRFGMVEAFWDTGAATEAGVAWERILFLWSQIQPNGPDDWNTLHVPDEWLQWAREQGREVVGLLKNTPHWASDAEPHMEASPPRGLDLPIDDPGNVWANYVRRVVTFYGERGVHRWIIWNEPDIAPGVYGQEWAGSIEQYYRLLKVAYLVIKQADPSAFVHLAGITYWHDRGWLRRFLTVATADPDGAPHGYFFDVVSLHIYFQTDSVDYVVNNIRSDLAAFGLSKAIWINETNASPDADPLWPLVRPRWRVDLTEQASFILQSYALGLAAGAERIAVYKLIDAGLPPGGEPFGLLRPDHSRRPAYTAYRLATQHYAGTHSAVIDRQPLYAQVTLDRGDRTTRVLWARTTADVSVTVPALAAQATLLDQEGNAQVLDASTGSYSLMLPGARCADEVLGCIIGGPVYLLLEQAPAVAVDMPEVATPSPQEEAVALTPTIELSGTVEPVSPAPTLSVTLSLSATLAPSATVTLSPTSTPSPTAEPTATSTPTATPTSTDTATPSPTSTPTGTPTQTPSPTATPSPLPSPSPSPTITPRPTPEVAVGEGARTLGLGAFILVVAVAGYTLWRRWQR